MLLAVRKARLSRKLRLVALLATISLLAMVWLAPSSANAAQVSYSCGLTAPGSWCQYGVWHNFYYADALYSGSGTLTVCEKAIRVSNNSTYEQACGNNFADANFARCNCGGLYILYVQYGNVAHHIDGHGAY